MDNLEDALLHTEEQAVRNITYSKDEQPFEEAELESLEKAFYARKEYMELAYPRF
jgi:hypothetical protein